LSNDRRRRTSAKETEEECEREGLARTERVQEINSYWGDGW